MADFTAPPTRNRSFSHQVDVVIESSGDVNSNDYRVFSKNDQIPESAHYVSMWHDIPLYPTSNVVNMICEIPKCTRKKYEIATTESSNPIKQDIMKDGNLREFRKGDVYFNYGCIPRTWEDPNEIDAGAGHPGDNDPLDVCEIGLRMMRVAEISTVKVLGVLCLIDEGETDWKIIAISTQDPWSGLLHDVSDVQKFLPGTLESIREWFRTYKTYDGKPPNEFGFNGEFLNSKYAQGVIAHGHESWKKLLSGAYDQAEGEEASADGACIVALPNQGMSKKLVYPSRVRGPTSPIAAASVAP